MFLGKIGNYFAFSRDRLVHGGVDGNCSIEAVVASESLSLEQKRAFFNAEVSWGQVEGPGRFRVLESTLPFQEGKLVDINPLCTTPFVSYYSTSSDIMKSIGCTLQAYV